MRDVCFLSDMRRENFISHERPTRKRTIRLRSRDCCGEHEDSVVEAHVVLRLSSNMLYLCHGSLPTECIAPFAISTTVTRTKSSWLPKGDLASCCWSLPPTELIGVSTCNWI